MDRSGEVGSESNALNRGLEKQVSSPPRLDRTEKVALAELLQRGSLFWGEDDEDEPPDSPPKTPPGTLHGRLCIPGTNSATCQCRIVPVQEMVTTLGSLA